MVIEPLVIVLAIASIRPSLNLPSSPSSKPICVSSVSRWASVIRSKGSLFGLGSQSGKID